VKLIALTTTALLVVAGSAQAAEVKVKPTASVVAATKSEKNVRFQIDIKFPIPLGLSAADCSGKVTVSTRLSKKKTAKWSGKLAAVGPDCVAKVKAKLAAAKYGKKLKFSVAYKGSKKLKPFSRSWNLKIMAPPPAPPLPPAAPPAQPPPLGEVGVHKKGRWDINANGLADNDDFEFKIEADYSVEEIFSMGSGEVQLNCESTPVQAKMIFNTGFIAKADKITVQSTQTYAPGKSMVHTFRFDWTSPISGVGEYSSTGEYNTGTEVVPEWKQCTGGFTFVLDHFEDL
jgi:hypothetical protein